MIKKQNAIFFLLLIISVFIIDAIADYRQEMIVSKRLLHVSFDHVDHKETQCVTCHHNFLDKTGSGTCYSCHKLETDIAPVIEDMFHTFCRDCHIVTRLKGQTSGPVRQCKSCHLKLKFIPHDAI